MISSFSRFAGFRLARIPQFIFCSEKPQPKEKDSELLKQGSEKTKLTARQLYSEFLKTAIVEAQQKKNDKIKGPEVYRAAILFDEILNRQTKIILYHTRGRLYWALTFWYLLGVGVSVKVIYDALDDEKWYKRDYNLLAFGVGIMYIASRIFLYRRMFKYHVESIVYDTISKDMVITKRSIIARRKQQILKPDKLLYTQDRGLNSKKINYINIDSLECYSIGYEFAWKNKELFSHLLQQNISNLKSYQRNE